MSEVEMGLVLDTQDPTALAPFWAAALGYVVLGEAGNYVLLLPDGRPGPKLLLQRVPEPKAGKNRKPGTSERYSTSPPAIAPRRLAPNAVVDAATSLKRWAKTRLARKIGAKAIEVAAANRGTVARWSSEACGMTHATASATSRA